MLVLVIYEHKIAIAIFYNYHGFVRMCNTCSESYSFTES